MKIAMVGLGRMGGNMARRLLRDGHQVVAFDRDASAVAGLAKEGATAAKSLEEVVAALDPPRVLWVMLPAGDPTEETIQELAALGDEGDIIVDGGNSYYRDDIRRSQDCRLRKVRYVDVGVSGGVWGLERGYCMMVGGDKGALDLLDPVLASLAPGVGTIDRTKGRDTTDDRAERGYIHAGPPGSSHFVKMVHNGIEYGIMQAYAEGFDILKSRGKCERVPESERFELNLTDVAEVWRRGSVISSWLLDLCATALAEDNQLADFSGMVSDSGEGQWTIDAAMEQAVPIHVLSAALFARYRSRVDPTFGDKLLSAMRFGFGGHVEMAQ
ncbi:phosphogluconate dehydrogenase (NAD(+)-dependent, decarboxylating) [Sphingomonas sp. PAMC 26605]|uniref:phosphogluconate dehydrogenase (NAD(+)-dependent, decarboxylating) n=1 Tax=Sphingomonas sp. PAMC 26605 TaxID=1112214 RepID=UPI00026CB5DA|nr:decarboxylating 6-phosphogluconate dehydrogenase [Sphingomonas sp. PAMC 26605]